MHYRSKATEVEAMQWDGSQEGGEAIDAWGKPLATMGVNSLAVRTHCGWMFARRGDFIVKADGEAWPIQAEVFKLRYEPIVPAGTATVAGFAQSPETGTA